MKTIYILMLSAAVICGGCAIGRKFDVNRTKDIKPGVTTTADLNEMFGKPYTTRKKKDGSNEIIWQYTKGMIGGLLEQQELRVYVDPEGKVKDFTLKQR